MSALLPNLKVVDKIENPEEIILTKGLLIDKLKIWGNKMVNKAKDFLTSQLAIPVLLASLLGYNIYTNQQANARIAAYELKEQVNHDLLITLKAQKEDAEKYAEKERAKLESTLSQMDREGQYYRESMNKKFNELEQAIKKN